MVVDHTGSKPVPVGIIGASGTSGTELARLLLAHPRFQVRFATSRRYAGQTLQAVEPSAPRLPLVALDEVDPSTVQLVFTCLPHSASAPVVERLLATGPAVVDLSGDFRLADPKVHASVYGSPRDPDVAGTAVYGLPELHRDTAYDTRLVANPGCYPTCSALGLLPLVRRGWAKGTVVIDAKSGVSGAGRSPKPSTLYVAVADDVRPYKLGHSHRHAVEIDQTLARVSPEGTNPPKVIFNPHVVPLERGMLATLVARVPDVSFADVKAAFHNDYDGEPFVDVRDGPVSLRAAARTPGAVVSVHPVQGDDHVVVTCAIDNLGKGAAAQAVQNANRLLGLPETTGLLDPMLANFALGETR